MSEFMRQTLKEKSYDLPFLFTQGTADQVCPPELAKTFFEQLDWPNKRFNAFEGMRHETFAEKGRDELFTTMGQWLDTFHASQAQA